ncbi:protein tyrosine kinase 18, partial [Aphelenchoides avenae]
WSFGVFAYEVFSGGAVPYASVPQGQLQERLDAGERLEQPDLCSADIYDLMLECWHREPKKRQAFVTIREFFSNILQRIDNGYAYL